MSKRGRGFWGFASMGGFWGFAGFWGHPASLLRLSCSRVLGRVIDLPLN